MPAAPKLSNTMSVDEFVKGYWYAAEIKAFAKEIGISPISNLRKDELEELIIQFLKTGNIGKPNRPLGIDSAQKDSENGLSLKLPIIQYTNNRETKEFIWQEARKIAPKLRKKSGAMYRLNRWREDSIASGDNTTYGDLVEEYVRLCRTEGSFPQAPSGRYINFVANFLKGEENATRERALKEWKALKKMPVEKTYEGWKEVSGEREIRGRRP